MARKDKLDLIEAYKQPPSKTFDWLTIDEVAEELRSSRSHVKTLLGQSGGPVRLEFFKHGHRTFVKRDKLERYKTCIESSTGVMRDPQRKGR